VSQIGSGGIFSIGSDQSAIAARAVIGHEADADSGAHGLPVGDEIVGAKGKDFLVARWPNAVKRCRMASSWSPPTRSWVSRSAGSLGAPRRRR